MLSALSFLQSRSVATNYTQAFTVTPSGNWDGNDGAWSTFMIRVGTPAQLFRVLPSTSGTETWVPTSNNCNAGTSWCGNARGVEPFNGAGASPFSGAPSNIVASTVDAGVTCTANKSPMCVNCLSVNGRCTNGACAGRLCCGEPPGACNSQGCNGLNGICTGTYIGCPCSGVDFNAPLNVTMSASSGNALAASGFQVNQSSSWTAVGDRQLMTESYLGVTSNGNYGMDTVGLGIDTATGLTSDHNVVAGVLTEPFYLGQVGLKPSNATVRNGNASFMARLKDANLIPSLSYGYTAGAIYRQQPILGSLTLGGYDPSRFFPNKASFSLAGNDSQSLMIGLESITATGALASNTTLLSDTIVALIDTTLPYLWLPLQTCRQFETAFGLSWDPSTSMYLVNDTIHQQLQNSNPSVTFTLGNSSVDQSINITLPYGAFDLQASNPIYPNGTNYFPLRRASNANQYILGRAFFQEAYLVVDYEQGNFSISQALFPINSNPNPVTINHTPQPPTSATTGTNPSSSNQSHHSLPAGAIAGIAIGALALLTILLLLITFSLIRRRRRGHHHKNNTFSTHPTTTSPNNIESTSSTTATTNPSPTLAEEKASWAHSPETTLRHHPSSTAETTTTKNDRNPSTPSVRELEDTQSPYRPGLIGEKRTIAGRSPQRQELEGSPTAKELPPLPPERAEEVSVGGRGGVSELGTT